jgi:hypothetical protein
LKPKHKKMSKLKVNNLFKEFKKLTSKLADLEAEKSKEEKLLKNFSKEPHIEEKVAQKQIDILLGIADMKVDISKAKDSIADLETSLFLIFDMLHDVPVLIKDDNNTWKLWTAKTKDGRMLKYEKTKEEKVKDEKVKDEKVKV